MYSACTVLLVVCGIITTDPLSVTISHLFDSIFQICSVTLRRASEEKVSLCDVSTLQMKLWLNDAEPGRFDDTTTKTAASVFFFFFFSLSASIGLCPYPRGAAIDWVETPKAESHLCASQPIKTITSWRLILQLTAHTQLGKQIKDCTEFFWSVRS